mmetsp:Transcript_45580/g.105283  ORF Transcript_45580/g.105283 Transcript_45580/m.105283 type:complete len:459 (-) Transcript_45580:102-1478(-)
MWARRCGAPPLWPSRTKVLLMSFMTAAAGVTIFSYMVSADPGYLDLEQPKHEEALCLTRWPLRHKTESWWSKEMWMVWYSYRSDMLEYVEEHTCTPEPLIPEHCATISVPLHQTSRNLGIPLGRAEDYRHSNDILEIYALLFLVLTMCMWMAVVAHDLALLTREYRHEVLDLSGIDRQFPWLRKLCCFCSFWELRTRLLERKPGFLGQIIATLMLVWGVFVFLLLMCPLAMLLFVRHPVKLARVQVFILCVAFAVMSLTLAFSSLAHLSAVAERPAYAITWVAGPCTCGCVFPFKQEGIWRVLSISAIVCYKSLMLGLRCLKGLRRANWANLMTVTFAVPMTAYPAEWTRADGTPIQYREEGDPVQGEPAFDPFAMMDEQQDSALMTIDLRPSRTADNLSKEKLAGSGPKVAFKEEEISNAEEIGCCGFPYLAQDMSVPFDDDEPKLCSDAGSPVPTR